MAELKRALGTHADMTVFRKLRQLSYHSSYSHRGKHYTTDETARFDQLGLWSFRAVWFSRHGTLINTCAVLVDRAEAGYTSDELEHLLHVQVKDPLRKLARQGRIWRRQVAGRFVHCCAQGAVRSEQLQARELWESQPAGHSFGAGLRVVPDELQAAIVLFYRRHRSRDAPRHRRRPDHWNPLDAPDYREDLTTARYPRYPGPAPRQPQTRRSWLRPRPRPVVHLHRRAAHQVR